MLCRLSVFAGGWDLRAAEAVCATEDTEVLDEADVLRSLVDKSLVQTDSTAFGLRYRLLETIRQFAAEKLAGLDEECVEAMSAHAQFFLSLAERSAPELRGPRQAEWLERLEADHDNLRSAIDKFLADPDAGSDILRIVVALARFFKARHLRGGVEVYTAALSHGGAGSPTALRAEALGVLGDIMEGPERRRHLEEGLAIARSLDNQALTAQLLTWLAWNAYQEGDLAGCAQSAEEAVAIARILRDPGLIGSALIRVAEPLSFEDPSKARAAYEEAITSLRLVGDHEREMTAVSNLGNFEFYERRMSTFLRQIP